MNREEQKRLKHLMIDHDIDSLTELAEKMGVHRSSLNNLYNGNRRNPKLRQKIADFFEVDPHHIFDQSPD